MGFLLGLWLESAKQLARNKEQEKQVRSPLKHILIVLAQWRSIREQGWALCGGAEKNRSLLFFMCPFSAKVWRGVLAHLGYFRLPQRWEIEWQWVSGEGRGRMAFSTTVYWILIILIDFISSENTIWVECKNWNNHVVDNKEEEASLFCDYGKEILHLIVVLTNINVHVFPCQLQCNVAKPEA